MVGRSRNRNWFYCAHKEHALVRNDTGCTFYVCVCCEPPKWDLRRTKVII